ncbi:scamp-domain-containing protein, partial [Pisolithus marmoratus]
HQVEDLERGERDLVQIPEQELNPRTEDIRRHRRNNWPSRIPLIFHSIPDDIPEASRPLVTRIYNLWLVLLNTWMLNVVGCIFASLSTAVAGSYDGGRSVGGSVCWAIIFSPLSFLLWYRPIYNGCMKEEALYYYIFFFSCGFHLYFSVFWFIGTPDSGIGGLIQTIQMYASGNWAGYIAGIIGTVTTAGFAVQGVGLAYYYRQVWNHRDAAGHTIRKAKAEVARKGVKAYFTRG